MLVLAHGGWTDTVACLHSVLAHTREDVRVVLCDNGSTDDSLERVLAWVEGDRETAGVIATGGPVGLPALRHPIATTRLDRAGIEAGRTSPGDTRLTIVETGENLGFGPANNVALRYVLSRRDAGAVWLLNNDTVVAPGSLEALERRMSEVPDAGICGSTVLHLRDPTRVQVLGSLRYRPSLGLSTRLGRGLPADRVPASPSRIENRMSFVYGASMLVRRELLETVGLLAEDTFLYHEELDWALRARPRWGLAWAPDSVVYHRGGATSGSAGGFAGRSAYSAYHLTLTKMWVTKTHFRAALPTVAAAQLVLAGAYAVCGRSDAASAVIGALRGVPLGVTA